MELIAHRGASAYAPENTLIAFKKAIELGIKAVEFDVQLSKDLELVVIHDYSLERTSNGKGKVKDLDLKELQSLDAGAWFSDEFKGEKIPSLREVLEVVKNNNFINIELKRDKRDKRNFPFKLIELINEMELRDKVLISSFDHDLLIDIFKMDNAIPLALLSHTKIKNLEEYIKNLGINVSSINLNKNCITKDYVNRLKKLEFELNIFTVNSYKEYLKLKKLEINRIFTNFPDLLSKNIWHTL